MSETLEQTLRSDLVLASETDALIRKAQELYGRGFTPGRISPSQMAALEERIVRARSFQEAVGEVEGWMSQQLDKLEARRARTDRTSSWLLAPRGESSADSLGEELVAYLKEGVFLGSEAPRELDRLAALRQFWGYFHAFFRYEAAFDGPTALRDPSRQSEDDS